MKTKRKLLAVLTLLSAINHPAFTVLAQTVFVANNSGSTTTAFTILKFDANGNGGIWVSNNGYSGSAWAVPAGVALDSNSNLFVAYSAGSSNFIKRFDAAGNGTIFASFATNFVPGIIAFDSHGNLFVVRRWNGCKSATADSMRRTFSSPNGQQMSRSNVASGAP